MLDKEDRERYKQNRGYNIGVTGCNKKCPCRSWVNCPAYVDITEQRKRLKSKSDETSKYIHGWYDKYFRIRYEFGDLLGNG